jgi:hypothetical protein
VTAGSNKVAFALGGLGGFNGHGVGFLQAARELGVKPAIITCTSGMIGWTAEWLDNQDLLPSSLSDLTVLRNLQPKTSI